MPLDDIREFLNPIVYREMKRRGWSDEHIAIRLDISEHAIRQFKRRCGMTKKYKNHK